MGIFSFLFNDEEDDDDDDELLDEEEDLVKGPTSKSSPASQLYEGMRLDVFKDGKLLHTGQITKRSEDKLTLSRLPGALSFKVCPLDADIALRGYDKRLVPINLIGAVEESSRVIFKVKNLRVQTHSEVRDNFRLPYSAPASIFREDDEHFRNPEECQLVDISTGGCGIESEYVHLEDDVVRIRIKLESYAPLTFLGQIVRCVDIDDGKFRYGILFAQLTDQETDTLSKTLYNLQMNVRDSYTRPSPGQPGLR